MILVVDDEAAFRHMMSTAIRKQGLTVREADSGEGALELMRTELPDLVFLDLRLAPASAHVELLDGIETLRAIRNEFGDVPVVLVTGYGDVQSAVRAMKLGALDFLSKPVDLDEIRRILGEALGLDEDRDGEPIAFGGIMPAAGPMRDMLTLLAPAADSGAPILVTGESGTGKELAARFVHENSPYSTGPFVTVNCSAIPQTLLESEMFGVEKGAFTGATVSKEGLFERSNDGSLLLDEIGEMDVSLQTKLLRVIQDKRVQRVGGTIERSVNVRIIASTNRVLQRAIAEGTFREDLYYRLNVFEVRLPALRDRPRDIMPLARSFAVEFASGQPLRIAGDVERLFMAHAWPGNVRELRNVLERAAILARGDVIRTKHLPPNLQPAMGNTEQEAQRAPIDVRAGMSIHDMERELILKTLEDFDGNRTRSATALGMSRRALHYKLKRYGIE